MVVVAMMFAAPELFGGISPQPAIDTDRSDCVYRLGEEATFTVRTGRTSGTAKWCLNNFGDGVFARGEADLSENGGVFTVRGAQTEPGFLRLDVTLEGDLTVEYWTYDGRVADTETRRVALPPDSAVEVGSVAAREGQFAHLVLTVGETVVRNDWHFKPYKDLPVAKSRIGVEVQACERTVRLSADKPAFFVWANAKGIRGEFSDSCLTLLPGRPVTLRFAEKGAFDAEAFSKALSVTSLSDVVE